MEYTKLKKAIPNLTEEQARRICDILFGMGLSGDKNLLMSSPSPSSPPRIQAVEVLYENGFTVVER